jgi:hypothetical protein
MSLASLPTELIESIATHLDLSGFCSLRLASHSLEERLLHVFRESFFRTRSLSWTKFDLDRFVEVSAHPDFGPALRHLCINATPHFSILLWQLRKRISESDAIHSGPNGVVFQSELQEQYIQDEKKAADFATFLNETRYDHKCLRTVFDKIRTLESIVFRYVGMDKKYGKFGRRYCESSQHEMSRPFVSTMAAVASSGVLIKEISIHPIYNYGAVSIGRLESLAPSLRNFDTTFQKLEKLELNLRDWRYPDTGFELESTRAPFVVRFLMKTHNVKHLSLSCYSSLDDNLVGELARSCSFNNLVTCRLSHFRLHNALDLSQLLLPSSTTLRGLEISHVVLRDENLDWAGLFCHLAASEDGLQTLERMRLTKLFTRSGSRLCYGDGENTDLVTGAEGVIGSWRGELLARINQLREGTWGPAWHLAAVQYPFIGMQT